MEPPTTSEGPAVSIVVASCGGQDTLRRCLESLEPERGEAEVIVVSALEPALVGRLTERFPWAVFQHAAGGSSVFRMRSLGVAHARGRLIALLEDHCGIAPGWLQALVAAHDAGQALLGGPVENGLPGSTRASMHYLVEYSALMPPLADGDGNAVLAVNAAYAREPLLACRHVWEHAFYDNEVCDALSEVGRGPHLVGNALVYSHLDMPLREAAEHLFAGGRRFGAYRKLRARRLTRLLLLLAAPVVPFVLFGRILARVAKRRPRRLLSLLAGAPYLVWLVGAWSAGEGLGYLMPAALEGS